MNDSKNDGDSLFHSVRAGSLRLKNNLFLAPVAGYSDAAFRSLCVEYGAGFTFTEMISSEALARSSAKTANLLARAYNETQYGAQLFGADDAVMARAVRILLETARPELIDVNAGCPVPKIVKTGAGAALLRTPETLARIIKSMRVAADEYAAEYGVSAVPISVKIRSAWDSEKTLYREAARAALENGCALITLHPRSRAQGYSGRADWSALADLAQYVRKINPNVPVFGSGDVFEPEDAVRMLNQTGCDGVMFARGAIGRPYVFSQTASLIKTGAYGSVAPRERMDIAFRELNRLAELIGEDSACLVMRKRFCVYCKGLANSASLRLRVIKANTISDYSAAVSQWLLELGE